jgi:transposase
MMKRKTTTMNDLSRCLDPLDMDATLIAVIEMSQSSWLVAGIVLGVERQPLKKIAIDEHALLKLLSRWREEAKKKGHKITRITVAFEVGHDGFWLARRLAAFKYRGPHHSCIECRCHARTPPGEDRSARHGASEAWLSRLAARRTRALQDGLVPTLAEEDAKRPSRERETLVGEAGRIITRLKAAFVRLGIRNFNPKLKAAAERIGTLRTPEGEPIPPNTLAALKRDLERHHIIKRQIREIEQTRLDCLAQAPGKRPHAIVLLLARVVGVGVETADMLVQEVLSRNMRDRRAVARYAGLTGSPDESGAKRREKGLARSGNACVRRGMIQLAWRFLWLQKHSALAEWYRQRTQAAPTGARKTLIVALARKLLIALWRLANDGIVPQGVQMRSA